MSDELRQSYLDENYAHTTHIFVATEYDYNIDENGTLIYDSDGKYTVDLTEEQKSEKRKKISEIDALELNSENFFEYQEKYNEDPAIKEYKNGYFVSSKIDYDTAYISAALTMEVGEIRKVEGENGVYYILKQEMPKGAYSDSDNADFFEKYDSYILDYLYWQEMDVHLDKITVNESLKKNISIKTVTPCWHF